MKNIKITFILMLFGFKLFSQKDFSKSIISNNNILRCSEYSVVPKTNSDYYKKLIGLKLKAEYFFDVDGNVIKYFSPSGAVASHSKPKDLKEYYFYKDNRIIKMSRMNFDSISVEYLYFDKLNLTYKIKTDDKNERIGLEIIYNDDRGKEIKKIEIDIHNTSKTNNYAYFYKTDIIYSKNKKSVKVSRKLINILGIQYYLFKSSINVELIEKELVEIEKSKFIDEVNAITLYFYNNQKQLVKETTGGRTIKYFYDKKGLLISRIDKIKNYSFKSKYDYYEK